MALQGESWIWWVYEHKARWEAREVQFVISVSEDTMIWIEHLSTHRTFSASLCRWWDNKQQTKIECVTPCCEFYVEGMRNSLPHRPLAISNDKQSGGRDLTRFVFLFEMEIKSASIYLFRRETTARLPFRTLVTFHQSKGQLHKQQCNPISKVTSRTMFSEIGFAPQSLRTRREISSHRLVRFLGIIGRIMRRI